MVPFLPRDRRSLARALGLLSLVAAVPGAGFLLTRIPITDALVAWPAVLVLAAAVGAAAAWTDRVFLVWVAALALSLVSVAGLLSIGFVFAPAALSLLAAAAALQTAGLPAARRDAILADPPGMRTVVRRTVAGSVGVVAGVVVIYLNAVARELFVACAVETVACQVGNTHWDAVAATLAGFAVVVGSVWLVWTQFAVARVVDTARST